MRQDLTQPYDLTVRDKEGNEKVVHVVPNEIGYGGFVIKDKVKDDFVAPPFYAEWNSGYSLVGEFLGWLVLLNFVVAIVNFLPLKVFDGGRIARIIYPSYLVSMGMSEERAEKVLDKIFLWVILGLLIINALPWFV